MSKTKIRNIFLFEIAGGIVSWYLHITPCIEGFFIAAAFFCLLWLAVMYLSQPSQPKVTHNPAPPVQTGSATVRRRNPTRTVTTVKRNQIPIVTTSKPVQTVKPVQPKQLPSTQPKQLPPMQPKTSKGSSRLFVPPPLD